MTIQSPCRCNWRSVKYPESTSFPLEISTSILSPYHCNKRALLVSRVPVVANRSHLKKPESPPLPLKASTSIQSLDIATRGQNLYLDSLSLPLNIVKSNKSPCHCR